MQLIWRVVYTGCGNLSEGCWEWLEKQRLAWWHKRNVKVWILLAPVVCLHCSVVGTKLIADMRHDLVKSKTEKNLQLEPFPLHNIFPSHTKVEESWGVVFICPSQGLSRHSVFNLISCCWKGWSPKASPTHYPLSTGFNLNFWWFNSGN